MTTVPYIYKATITEAYDGDTMTARVDLGMGVYKVVKLRLFGVDTPELRGEEREEGLVVRDHVRDLILGKEVVIKTHKDKKGKYGRWLAEILFELNGEETDLSTYLLLKGLASKY